MDVRIGIAESPQVIEVELENDVDPLGQLGEDLAGLGVGLGRHRRADVGALAQLGNQRDLGQEGDLELVGQLLAPSGAEQLVALAVIAGEPTHVLDDAGDRDVDLVGHVGGPLGHLLGCRWRLGHGGFFGLRVGAAREPDQRGRKAGDSSGHSSSSVGG